MRRTRLLLMFFITAAFLFGIGLAESVVAQTETPGPTPPPGSEHMAVKETPPAAPNQDTIPPQPSPQHVWQPGFWTWKEGHSWVWVPGRWAVPPHPACGVWIPGHWAGGWQGYSHWVPGHWACYVY